MTANMNKKRRTKLEPAIQMLSEISKIVEMCLDEEQDCLDNIPEGLQFTERYEKIEASVDNLESAIEHIDSARDNLLDAML